MRQGRDPESCDMRELMCTEKDPGLRASIGLPCSALGLPRSGLIRHVADSARNRAIYHNLHR